MITDIKNANDALAALNENFSKLVKRERKPLDAKEVNNTIGKMTNVVKTQLMHQMWTDNKAPLEWLQVPDKTKQIS